MFTPYMTSIEKKAGAFWKPIRKLLNPTFNLKILQSFVPIFNDKTNIMLENLDKEAGNPNFDLSKYMHACTLDMVCGELKIILRTYWIHWTGTEQRRVQRTIHSDCSISVLFSIYY